MPRRTLVANVLTATIHRASLAVARRVSSPAPLGAGWRPRLTAEALGQVLERLRAAAPPWPRRLEGRSRDPVDALVVENRGRPGFYVVRTREDADRALAAMADELAGGKPRGRARS